MKILITGSNGMLGADLIKILEKNNQNDIMGTDVDTLDITKLNEIKQIFKSYNPDIVINVAAYTDVDGCETNKDLAYSVNVIGPKNLAICSKEYGCILVHISTDYVFNGENSESFTENDNTGPINYYGETKLQSELVIQKLTDNYFIIRTAWLYGKNGDNFVKTMLKLSENNSQITVVNDQRGSPTYTVDLANAISEIIKTEKYGVYHVTNSDSCTWFEFACNIFDIANIDIDIKPITTLEYPTPAKRPKYSVLSNKKWKMSGFKPLRSYKKALIEYMGLELKN